MGAPATPRDAGAARVGSRICVSLEVFGMRPGLERVDGAARALWASRRTPFRAIHVVGTNGKSSTTRYCEAILRAHGLRSGAYLSPHITGFAERVVVDGRPLDEARSGRRSTRSATWPATCRRRSVR